MTAMIDAYNNRIPGTDYREAVAETCRVCIARITPPFQAIRYAEAMDRRDFIFDVLLEEAEFYPIPKNRPMPFGTRRTTAFSVGSR